MEVCSSWIFKEIYASSVLGGYTYTLGSLGHVCSFVFLADICPLAFQGDIYMYVYIYIYAYKHTPLVSRGYMSFGCQGKNICLVISWRYLLLLIGVMMV